VIHHEYRQANFLISTDPARRDVDAGDDLRINIVEILY